MAVYRYGINIPTICCTYLVRMHYAVCGLYLITNLLKNIITEYVLVSKIDPYTTTYEHGMEIHPKTHHKDKQPSILFE